MATNSLLVGSGTQAWDVGSNWSLGTVPQSGDDVVVTGSATASLTLTIVATDPAYTIASLTETTTNPRVLGEVLNVGGSLTVTGTTSISTGWLEAQSQSTLSLNTVVLTNSAELISLSQKAGGFTVTSLGSGNGSSGTALIEAGTATIGSLSGVVTVLTSNATTTIGSTSGSNSLQLSGNARLDLQSSASTLNDQLLDNSGSNLVDLQNIAFQPGETVTSTLVSSGLGAPTFKVVINSALGQPVYTFSRFGYAASSNGSAPPVTLGSDGGLGTLVSIACYCHGTAILTARGDVPVEDLAIGDTVVTLDGTPQTIRWLGRRSYAGRFLTANPGVQPVRFAAGSLGQGIPLRDLRVSPEHAMFLDGILVPARCLVNGVTIVQERACRHVDYVHVELDRHDILLAEGAPSESYLDDDSRAVFHNAAEFAVLYPAAHPSGRFYAPRVEDGPLLEAVRQRLPNPSLPPSLAA